MSKDEGDASAFARSWRDAPIERERLVRALYLTVERYDGNPDVVDGVVYVVHEGLGSERHWVQGGDVAAPLCDCADHAFREGLCAHALAVLVELEDSRVMDEIARIVRTAAREGRLVLQVTKHRIRASRVAR